MVELRSSRREVLGMVLVCEGGLGVLAWLLGRWFGHPPLAALQWQAKDLVWGVALSLPMLPVFLVLVHGRAGPMARIRRFCDEVVRPLFASCTLFDLAVISLLAGVGEEMFFRGFLQAALGAWLGDWAGLLLASLLFGILHPITPTYVVFAAAVGVYLGYAFHVSGSLLAVIVAHALYDFLALVYLLRLLRPKPH